ANDVSDRAPVGVRATRTARRLLAGDRGRAGVAAHASGGEPGADLAPGRRGLPRLPARAGAAAGDRGLRALAAAGRARTELLPRGLPGDGGRARVADAVGDLDCRSGRRS